MTRRTFVAAASAAAAVAKGFDPAFSSAAEIAAAIRAKKISAVEACRIAFERIDKHNPALNAVVWPFREAAMERAKKADGRKAGGPLHGVPVTIKDSFAYVGSPSTWGLPPFKDAKSTRTAVAVERLEAAGAIVLGKTNVAVALGDWQSYNPIYGTSNNPWDVKRTPGGSTGGGAAALAAGIGALTLGSDIGGSIRIPAHFCGLYGHKPTLNLVSSTGHQPGAWSGQPGYPMDLAVAGPLARDARDLLTALEVMGGPEAEEARAWKWTMPAPRKKRLAEFRVGYMMEDPSAPVASDVMSLYEAMLSELGRAGVKLEKGWPSGMDVRGPFKTYQYLIYALTAADSVNAKQMAELRAAYEKDEGNIYAAAAAGPHVRFLKETVSRLAFRAVWSEYFATHDVFLTPAAFSAAFAHDHSSSQQERTIETPEGKRPYGRMLNWIWPATLAGIPATVAPVGRTKAGLPAGVQILGPMWEDATTIEFAALLAERIVGFTAPPGY